MHLLCQLYIVALAHTHFIFLVHRWLRKTNTYQLLISILNCNKLSTSFFYYMYSHKFSNIFLSFKNSLSSLLEVWDKTLTTLYTGMKIWLIFTVTRSLTTVSLQGFEHNDKGNKKIWKHQSLLSNDTCNTSDTCA